MGVAITKMSQNGQIVIPSEIRKEARIKPFTKFIIFNEDGDIYLKKIEKEELLMKFDLMNRIEKSEEEIAKGQVLKADTKMTDEDIDNLLMSD
jgi:AbrB family looped-hinge helix DNA binding protein